MRNSDRGFTLIEVLGAVALLAILYTTLSTIAIRGLRSEGESRRMLEASLLADWELSEFELVLDKGDRVEIGFTEVEEQDGFTVTWDVTPLETPIFQNLSANQKDTNPWDQVSQNAQAQAGQIGAPGGAAPPFLQLVLKVSWFEAGYERSVTRTIFAVDEDAAAEFAAASVKKRGANERDEP
jgi:prepilin-type N-terminal cleavage/methylation domain-containing protein